MYKGQMIEELMQMVERAEDHARAVRLAQTATADEQTFVSRMMYVPDAQPIMIGVA